MPRPFLISSQSDYLIHVFLFVFFLFFLFVFFIEIHIFNDKQCRTRSVGFYLSGSTLFAKIGHVVFSKRRVKVIFITKRVQETYTFREGNSVKIVFASLLKMGLL